MWLSQSITLLQCVAVCCSVLQCVAVCCSVLQCVEVCCSVLQCFAVCRSVLQCVAVCCRGYMYISTPGLCGSTGPLSVQEPCHIGQISRVCGSVMPLESVA